MALYSFGAPAVALMTDDFQGGVTLQRGPVGATVVRAAEPLITTLYLSLPVLTPYNTRFALWAVQVYFATTHGRLLRMTVYTAGPSGMDIIWNATPNAIGNWTEFVGAGGPSFTTFLLVELSIQFDTPGEMYFTRIVIDADSSPTLADAEDPAHVQITAHGRQERVDPGAAADRGRDAGSPE